MMPASIATLNTCRNTASVLLYRFRDCADFLRGLAFTGLRKAEANELEWRDLEFGIGEIVVR